MQQQESIYNIIPKEKIIPGKDPLYKSQYPYWIAPTASTFILKNTSYPNVANMNGDVYLEELILLLKNLPQWVDQKEDTNQTP